MCIILNIETATTVCSVSVSRNDEIITYEEVNGGYTHAENLHVFIKEVMLQAGLEFKELDAVSVSKGPGSYTGLRIGVSAAKGLAYALGIPLIAVDTLQLMAQGVLFKTDEECVLCPMIDARRMEVYCAVYNRSLENILPVEALIIDQESIQKFKTENKILFFGDGMAKCREVLQTIPGARFMEEIYPSSENMAKLVYKSYAEKRFEDVAYFEPYYLKEFLITSKKKPTSSND